MDYVVIKLIFLLGSNQSLKQKMVSKKYSIEVPSGYGLSHKIVFQNVIKYYSKNRKTKKPLKAIETLDTLKLIHMMYRSSKKIIGLSIKIIMNQN